MNTTTPFSKVRVALALIAVFALTVTITFGARRLLSRPLDCDVSHGLSLLTLRGIAVLSAVIRKPDFDPE